MRFSEISQRVIRTEFWGWQRAPGEEERHQENTTGRQQLEGLETQQGDGTVRSEQTEAQKCIDSFLTGLELKASQASSHRTGAAAPGGGHHYCFHLTHRSL